ncbi:MAG: sensor histidine kinase, partial [Acutalibacteraceae bacterium]
TEITISDSGNGIDKDDLAHIFDRFYKGKNSSDKSFGIGLALAQTIITGQDGTIKASNARNGGAQFTIRFYKQTV